MVRTKLSDLKLEINSYLGIPYFSNVKKSTSPENVLVGKGSAKEIALKTIELANLESIKLLDLTSSQIYNFQKKHDLGIDCSGLVFNLLQFIKPNINNILIGTEGIKGVRRLSASLLTSPPNATKINDYNSVKTGDLIRVDDGKHVLFVIEKIGNIIYYVHNSGKTKTKGVHLGTLEIVNPQQPLNHQKWSDVTKENKNYNTLINSKKDDGFYRIDKLK
jgi:hypothetical protein